MFRSLWFHKLLALRSRSVRRRQAAQDRRFVRLHLEGLEERVTPTVFLTATNGAELQAAITTANTASRTMNQQVVINLTGSGPYALPAQQEITSHAAGVTIEGHGQTLDAAANSRLFLVDSGANLTLEKMTLTGGNVLQSVAGGGGAIKDAGGTVTLSAATVQNNAVHSGLSTAQGGGIFVSGGGTLAIEHGSHIDNNQAIGTNTSHPHAGIAAQGGGVFVSGPSVVTITSSTISNNIAQGGDQVSGTAGGAAGGGIFATHGVQLTLTNTTLRGDQALAGNGVVTSAGQGGAEGGNAAGGGVYVSGSGWNVTISGSTFAGNSALGGNGAARKVPGIGANGNGGFGLGGGIATFDSGSGVTIVSSSFTNNIAQGGAGGVGGGGTNVSFGYGGLGGTGGQADGGAADIVFGGGPLTITRSNFTANQAIGGAGGAGGVGATHATTGGHGGAGGGGGSVSGGGVFLGTFFNPMNITNSSFTDNSATGGAGGKGGDGGIGGASSLGGDGGFGGFGGAVGGNQVGFGGGGGGVFAGGISNGLTMINCTVGANTAQGGNAGAGGAGGVGGSGPGTNGPPGTAGNASGGGLADTNPAATLTNDTIAFNQALAGSGGTVAATAHGGGASFGSGLSTLTNVLLEDNQATTTGPDVFGSVSTSSDFNFVSNTGGSTGFTGPNNILNNQLLQLASLTTAPSGLAYYPLLANSVAINAGNNAVVPAIAAAEGVSPDNATDEIGGPRVVGSSIDIGAIEFRGHHHG
jgi:hypothetical protein